MAILGMGPDDYEKYTNHVREEYDFLDDVTYKELRVKVNKFKIKYLKFVNFILC